MSKIEWTDTTWNVTSGCTRASAGCDNCYAVRQTKRLAKIGSTRAKYEGLINDGKNHFNGQVRCHESELLKPFSWSKPRMVFVNSMSDLFHKDVPFEFLVKVYAVMAHCHWHTFQVLTKRAERLGILDNSDFINAVNLEVEKNRWHRIQQWPLQNVWTGVSVESGKVTHRVDYLRESNASIKFLSCEPLLGYISGISLDGIDWVIAGGESGIGARPMDPEWARSLRDQCVDAGVPFFFKQWGEWAPGENCPPPTRTERVADYFNGKWNYTTLTPKSMEGMHCDDEPDVYRIGKKKAGRVLDGRTWDEMPEVKS